MTISVDVAAADLDDLEDVTLLFDAYRRWYGEAADQNGARHFIAQRLRQNQSTIFLARYQGSSVGFAQLYPMFSSIGLAEVWILNDLFVAEAYRGDGVGTVLLETAVEFARQTGAKRIELATEVTNKVAQQVYERHGWQTEDRFLHYTFSLDDDSTAADTAAAESPDADASTSG